MFSFYLITIFFLIATILEDYSKYQANTAIKGFDVLHQLFRLRYTKNMHDSEALTIMRSLAEGVKGYDQVVEVNMLCFIITM